MCVLGFCDTPPPFVLYMLFWQQHHAILCCRNQYTADPKFNFSSPHPLTSYLFFHPVWGGKGKGSSGITFWSQTQVRPAKWRRHPREWTNKLAVKDSHVWDTNYCLCWANLHADLLLPASSPLSASEIRLDLRFSLCLYAQVLGVWSEKLWDRRGMLNTYYSLCLTAPQQQNFRLVFQINVVLWNAVNKASLACMHGHTLSWANPGTQSMGNG